MLGWQIATESLANSVQRAWDLAQVPVWVTESGLATTDDAERIGTCARC